MLAALPARGQVLPFRVERARKPAWRTWQRAVQKPAQTRQYQAVRPYLRSLKAQVIDRIDDAPALTMLGRARSLAIRRDMIADIIAYLLEGDQAAFASAIDPGIHAAVKEGADYIASLLPGATWDPVRDPSDQIIASEVRWVTDETKAWVAEVIGDGLREGQTVSEMTARLQLDSRGIFGPERALRIARTESGKALNEGHAVAYQGAALAGVGFEVEWTAALVNTRPSHVAMDGQRIAPGGLFTITIGPNAGEKAHAPGGFASAAEVVNCVCATFPVILD